MSLRPEDHRERWWLPLLVPGILAVTLVTALALTRDSALGHEDARAFLHAIPPFEVEEGEVVYTRTENYLRFGPKADVIRRQTGLVSESFEQGSWVRIGPNNTKTHILTRHIDDSGSVYMESWSTPEGYQVTDPRTARILEEGPRSVTELADIASRNIESFTRMLDDQRVRVVGLTDTTLTLEVRFPRPDLGSATYEDETSFSIPFYADLEPSERVDRFTINNDGIVIARESFAITGAGDEVLVLSERMTVDVLDTMPAPPAGGQLQ